MLTDSVILLLLFAIAAVVGIILWNSGKAKTYDPNAVDLSKGYDPKHDHFSAAHAKKLQQLTQKEKTTRRRPVSMAKPEPETTSNPEWSEHLVPPEQRDGKVVRSGVERRSETDRRANSDRRIFEDRRQSQENQ
ncbi:hypothetical protein MMIC_P2332 [Mariprofundus micogutta]|uniref:Uncharacterized protein n=1 Tax=Mariprofundus micogutta TaxID=1921010 RepID=A0A1L8CR14_9PROT|nr:hypothetical protein [Mariprofundus micogutta]GAV21348.1 hypothetical protein MMIC_P2332 [Mariprofundus micogutta]